MMEDEKKNRCNKYILLYLRNYICYNNYINELYCFYLFIPHKLFYYKFIFFIYFGKKSKLLLQGLSIMLIAQNSLKKITILSILI